MATPDSDKASIVKHYSNGTVTVVWQPALCIHSRHCVRGLPGVFDFERRPWIDPTAAASPEIMRQIEQCPSGALSYFLDHEAPAVPDDQKTTAAEAVPIATIRVEVSPGGPLLISGPVVVRTPDGLEHSHPRTSLCRCGQSKNKPYCDGTHRDLPPGWDQAGANPA
ncbi:(4Fe-4S)-binding protein [Hymenobacter sp. BT730]|uniref:(4Fe-4S)-binding protein n=1 Tax=Hymenobacter sp. BT730 TaxID=3063332 RepID=UPI0026DF834C|nr:(4Fe-4S)-binding protein [Hymenobacter sp. BT730]